MGLRALDELSYCILDPTGNITALVESAVDPAERPVVARAIMREHPAVEQVGFVRFFDPDDSGVQGELRMAGGEFCGNATMCAAALYRLHAQDGGTGVKLRVSGAESAVEVRLGQEADGAIAASVHMPPALSICEERLSFDGISARVPVVRMQGISHAIIQRDSAFFGLLGNRPAAERAVRAWCTDLAAEGLGLMFIEQDGESSQLTPLVFVPGSGTVFWESSCASGTSAAGMYLAAQNSAPVDVAFCELGGTLRVTSSPSPGETWLHGSVRHLS